MKANRLARNDEALIGLGSLLSVMFVIVFAAVLLITVATESNTAANNASVNATSGASSILRLLPLAFLGIVLVGVGLVITGK